MNVAEATITNLAENYIKTKYHIDLKCIWDQLAPNSKCLQGYLDICPDSKNTSAECYDRVKSKCKEIILKNLYPQYKYDNEFDDDENSIADHLDKSNHPDITSENVLNVSNNSIEEFENIPVSKLGALVALVNETETNVVKGISDSLARIQNEIDEHVGINKKRRLENTAEIDNLKKEIENFKKKLKEQKFSFKEEKKMLKRTNAELNREVNLQRDGMKEATGKWMQAQKALNVYSPIPKVLADLDSEIKSILVEKAINLSAISESKIDNDNDSDSESDSDSASACE
jgi:hypothetical protein